MFDFEKLAVYKKAKSFNSEIRDLIKSNRFDTTTTDQLKRAAFSVVLNIAEGSGRFSKADRCNFFIISRSSLFECVAILDVIKDEDLTNMEEYNDLYSQAEELSRVLCAMIKNLKNKKA